MEEKMGFKRHEDVLEECVLPYCAQTTNMAPLFSAEAYNNMENKMIDVNLESYRGKWVILFF